MIVVDTDVLTYFWAGTPRDRVALAEAVRRKDSQWLAPAQWRPELRNVLATYMRQGLVTVNQAIEIVQRCELDMQARTFSTAAADVLRLADESNCTAFDCEFVATAQMLGATLVTGDRKLAAAFPETAVTMEEFVGG